MFVQNVVTICTDESTKTSATSRWSVKRGTPFGSETWIESVARRLDLESTLRPRGRPRVRSLPERGNNDFVTPLFPSIERNG